MCFNEMIEYLIILTHVKIRMKLVGTNYILTMLNDIKDLIGSLQKTV